jgi:hypothetical protein
MINSKQKRQSLKKFLGVLLIIAGILSGFGNLRGNNRDDARERGRALQSAAISAGCILIGILLLCWKDKQKGESDD